jgi:hypothetical protein
MSNYGFRPDISVKVSRQLAKIILGHGSDDE